MYKNLIELFKENEGKGAVGAFNLHCFEMLPAMIQAAEELNVPIIIQTSLGTAEYIGFEPLIAAVKALAEKSSVNVALHMDHCKSVEALKKAIDLGYSSVMYDGSALPIEENIKNTQEVVEYAHAHGVSVEGEIGSIGGAEEGVVVEKDAAMYTKPEDALHYVNETHVDALAVSIGTTHGQFKSKAKINYELLTELKAKLGPVGLVLHGGTGVSDEDMKRCVREGMKKINVGTELNKSYIEVVNTTFPDATPLTSLRNLLGPANEKIKEVFKGKKIMIISDDQVYPLYGDDLTLNLEKDFKVNHVVVPHGEKSKRFDMLPTLYKACLDFKLTRTDLIIALGGGVIGDMAGFVASSYLRGVKLVQIPTSLLAQVDSSVGGKVAVDLPEGKNLVGAFYHPSMVLIDPCTLKTLDPHFISDGMGEVIKYGCIKDKKLFDQLNSYQNFEELYEFIDEIIYNCVNIKREVVEKDQFDFGDRLLLNFGHTYAHAIEQYYHYEKYSHGEAVGIGMYQITKLAESLDLTKTGSSTQIKEILQKYNLPYECQVETKNLIQAISLDKKNINNSLSVVLLKEIGNSYVYQTNQEFLLKKERV